MPIILKYPFIPKVDGNNHDTYFQNVGISDPGQEMPDIKSNGTERKTNSMMQSSLLYTNTDSTIAIKIHANIYGMMN